MACFTWRTVEDACGGQSVAMPRGKDAQVLILDIYHQGSTLVTDVSVFLRSKDTGGTDCRVVTG